MVTTVLAGCAAQSPMATMCEAASLTAGAIVESELAAQVLAASGSNEESGTHIDRAARALTVAKSRLDAVRDPDFRADEAWSGLNSAAELTASALTAWREGEYESADADIRAARTTLATLAPPIPVECMAPLGDGP